MKMQQTKSYWRMLAVGSVMGAFIASACVITTDDPDDIDTAGSGGQATASGGKASGGSTATGGSATAGSAPAGGSGGTGNAPGSFQCDPPSEAGAAPVAEGTPLSCEPGTSPNACDKCVQTKCCAEYGACYATDPGNQCGYGGPLMYNGAANVGELQCFTVCLQNAVAKSQIAPTAEEIGGCASECATVVPGSAMDCKPVVGQQTSDAVACQIEKCSPDCYPTN